MRSEVLESCIYHRQNSIVFLKTHDSFGGLSNMAGGYPLRVNGIKILTTEALYQACRFPHMPEIQKIIISQPSPMTAKMKSKPYRKNSRSDWGEIQAKIMWWCLRIKLAQNWETFSKLLIATGDRAIVEESRRDQYWGAKRINDEDLKGTNMLGKLLVELREKIKQSDNQQLMSVAPLAIPNFTLLSKPILTIYGINNAIVSYANSPKQQETESNIQICNIPDPASEAKQLSFDFQD